MDLYFVVYRLEHYVYKMHVVIFEDKEIQEIHKNEQKLCFKQHINKTCKKT